MSTSRSRTRANMSAVPMVLVLALAGCGTVPESESPGEVPAATSSAEAAPSTQTAPTPEQSPTSEAAPTTGGGGDGPPVRGETGSLEAPIPLGSTVQVGDWTVTVESFDKDASEALSAAEVGNGEPAEGTQYAVLTVSATYEGEETGQAFIDLWFELLGPGGSPTSDTEGEFCSAGMKDLIAVPEAQPGETVDGLVCFIVASEDIDDSVLLVEELMSIGREGSYFVALE